MSANAEDCAFQHSHSLGLTSSQQGMAYAGADHKELSCALSMPVKPDNAAGSRAPKRSKPATYHIPRSED